MSLFDFWIFVLVWKYSQKIRISWKKYGSFIVFSECQPYQSSIKKPLLKIAFSLSGHYIWCRGTTTKFWLDSNVEWILDMQIKYTYVQLHLLLSTWCYKSNWRVTDRKCFVCEWDWQCFRGNLFVCVTWIHLNPVTCGSYMCSIWNCFPAP